MNVICIDGQTRQIQTTQDHVTVGEYADRIAAALADRIAAALAASGSFTLKLDGHLAHPDCPLTVLAVADTIEQVGVGEADWYAIDEFGALAEPDVAAETPAPVGLPVLDLDAASTMTLGEIAVPAAHAPVEPDVAGESPAPVDPTGDPLTGDDVNG